MTQTNFDYDSNKFCLCTTAHPIDLMHNEVTRLDVREEYWS